MEPQLKAVSNAKQWR